MLLPSLLLQANNIGLFLARIALIMLNISIFLSITSWPQFIQGLKQLHLPNVIILTLDITMKYVYTLGVYIQELLSSIKLRTFGQHVNRRVLGVIIGQVYLSAKNEPVIFTKQCYYGDIIVIMSQVGDLVGINMMLLVWENCY